MSILVTQDYISIGGNRNSAASSWSLQSGLLAFGADQNVAIWEPLSTASTGIRKLWHGHKDKVTAVEFLEGFEDVSVQYLLSGSADGKLLMHTHGADGEWHFSCEAEAHTGAVNCISTLQGSNYFATGGADAKIKIWKIENNRIAEVLAILPKPRLIPLSLALGSFPNVQPDDGLFLAAGGTRNDIQIYALKELSEHPKSQHQATLTGHEGWVRSLSLKAVSERELLLASASHDKYVRLWRFVLGGAEILGTATARNGITTFEQTLTAKIQTVSANEIKYSITFDALLLGHEDWVYSAAWNPAPESEQLLTASADGTLTIWELDSTSGIWVSASRLGEISGQKGATTATGSSGGFWTGMWSPDGKWVTCLGRTGSWRIWHFDQNQQYWVQKHGVSGHVSSANGLTWSPSGGYLLSTSSDQTTRLHAEWKRNLKRTWHEFARPQIHGYDLNSVSSTGEHQFASGAGEKLLRVFDEPKDVAKMLTNLCEIEQTQDGELSETAAIPVLGLSNKAMDDDYGTQNEINGNKDQDYIAPDATISVANIEEPPTEDLLARHTLWPEHEKLYGHGYEISESAYSDQNHVLATACKASSTDHAVIRLYDTHTWNEIKPPLTAHSLTVTRLAWSHPPSNYLLSVGRDRQWAIFTQDDDTKAWRLQQLNAKAHTRMILDAAWCPTTNNNDHPIFATAGRDKAIKIWQHDPQEPTFTEQSTIKHDSAVTALSFTTFTTTTAANYTILAAGEENGTVSLHIFNKGTSTPTQTDHSIRSFPIDRNLSPSKAVTRIAWRPKPQTGLPGSADGDGDGNEDTTCRQRRQQLAVAAADGSVRILSVDLEEVCKQSS